MTNPIQSFSCKALRPGSWFKGRSPAPRALRSAAMLASLLAVAGCQQLIVLHPKGVVAEGTTSLLTGSFIIMLPVVVPTILAALVFGWWYRASNKRATYEPTFVESGKIELLTWSVPLLTIMLLGSVTWIGSHDLDPAKPLSDDEPLEVQVVALDWKWLFIYPDQNVASVNRLVIPAGVPIRFTLTSASVMNAFFVPQLGSMIYTMNGMATQLNLKAGEPGTFMGLSAMFSGNGFADMHFKTEAVPIADFNAWAQGAKSGGGPPLSSQAYKELSVQSMNVAPFTYSSVEPGLFGKVVMQELPPGPGPSAKGGF